MRTIKGQSNADHMWSKEGDADQRRSKKVEKSEFFQSWLLGGRSKFNPSGTALFVGGHNIS